MTTQTPLNPETGSEEAGATTALWSVALVGAVLTLSSPILFGVDAVLSVGLGGVLAVANLWAIARFVRNFLFGAGARLPWALIAGFKFLVLLFVLAVASRSGVIQILPFVVGYGALPLGIVLAQLKSPPVAAKPRGAGGES